GGPVLSSKSAIRAWCEGRPCSSLPGNTATSLVSSVPGSHAGITPSRPRGANDAVRGGTELSPLLTATNAFSSAAISAVTSSNRSTSARDRTSTWGTAGPHDNAAHGVGSAPAPAVRLGADRGLRRTAGRRYPAAAGSAGARAPHRDPSRPDSHRG